MRTQNIELPNGFIVEAVPDNVTDDEIRLEAIKNGWAQESDFPAPANQPMGAPPNADPMAAQPPQAVNDQMAVAAGMGQAPMPVEPPPQESTLGEEIVGGLETGAAMVSGAVAPIAGGLAGIAQSLNPFAKEGAGAEAVESVSEALTYNPRTDEGKRNIEAIGGNALVQSIGSTMQKIETTLGDAGYDAAGPLAGALATAVPTALMELAGFKAPAVAAKIANKQAEKLDAKAATQKAEIESIASPEANDVGMEKLALEIDKSAANNKIKKPMPDIEIDPKVIKAAKDLGIDEVPVGIATSDPQMRTLSTGLASLSGSKMQVDLEAFDAKLTKTADKIIKDGGGNLDKAELSEKFRVKTSDTVSRIKNHERRIFDGIKEQIKPETRVEVPALKKFIDNEIKESGGVGDLPAEVKKIAGLIYDKDGAAKTPTYKTFEYARRSIGQALSKKSGAFSDGETATLKRLYGAMATSQKAIAKERGLDKALETANKWTVKRKKIEENITEILGRKVNKDLMPGVGTKIKGLEAGRVAEFNKFVDRVPERMRKEVVVSALNDIMKGSGADQTGLGVAKLSKFMANMKRSPKSKAALYKHLPRRTQVALDNFGILGEASYLVNKKKITTGKIQEFLPSGDGKIMTMAKNMMATTAGTIAAVKTGGFGGGAVSQSIKELLDNTSMRAKRANEFISSPSFKAMIMQGAKNQSSKSRVDKAKLKALEKTVIKSAKYKRWAKGLDESAAAKIASIGIMTYLITTQDDDDL